MINLNDLKPGITFKDKDDILLVLSASHSHQGRGQATVKLKVKNLISGSIVIKTYSGNIKFEKAHIQKENAFFSYSTGSEYVFMNENTFEEVKISIEKLEWEKNFIVEEDKVILILFEGSVIGITLKPSYNLKVIFTEPAVAGNTASGKALKSATIETGYTTQVPLFINNNDYITISTEDGTYIGRAKKD